MVNIVAISEQIWDMKYRLKTPDGQAVDKSIAETWWRVARSLAEVEREPDIWAQRFYDVLAGFQFLPAGRIIAGAGTGRSVTLFNCFVMGTIPDDMGAIFDNLREAALTMQQGGGIGYDFSTIRPKGAPVHGVGADASGPLSFMDVWDAMCRTIMSAGARRGAMMATLRCDHPDIEAFVAAKREPGRLRNFNLSVLVTDAFMQAVADGAAWDLVFNGKHYRTIEARALWDKIMQATYDYAEPGVIFIDRINRRNNLWYCEHIASTNPCGEQPLPPYGACLLGSINLASLVRNPFSSEAALDLGRLAEIVPVAVRMMDNVVDLSRFPLEPQRREAEAKRRIGLGVTGLADALIMCGLIYGSPPAVAMTETWMRELQRAAYQASIDLAVEKGAFALFDREKYLAGESIAELDADLRTAIATHGIRNALVTSVAPTGTISLFADNISSGLEPVFSFRYLRTVLMPDGTRRQEEVSDYAYRLFRKLHGEAAELPASFVDAQTLSPEAHVVMQAAVQKYIDSSISKTINLPADIDFAAFKHVYRQAYESGCKGCTTYRPNDVTGSVLSLAPPVAVAPTPPSPVTTTLPETLEAKRYMVPWAPTDSKIFINLGRMVEPDGRRRVVECFINQKSQAHAEMTAALSLTLSHILRHDIEPLKAIADLKAVSGAQGAWHKGRFYPGLVSLIADTIEQDLLEVQTGERRAPPDAPPPAEESPASGAGLCPSCGLATYRHVEGCGFCSACQFSNCG